MKAEEFDKKFDGGQEDILDHFDLSNVRKPNIEQRRINIDFPTWMVEAMDYQAARLGINRQALVKTWVADKLGKA